MAENPIRPWFAKRLTELWNVPSETTPEPVHGTRLFFRRNSGLQNQSVLYVQDYARIQTTRTGRSKQDFARRIDCALRLLALARRQASRLRPFARRRGLGRNTCLVDVASGNPLPDVVRWLRSWDLAWTNDDKGFYYSRFPQPQKGNEIGQELIHQALYYHVLGASQSADRLIYARPDLARWLITPQLTENGRYLLVSPSSTEQRRRTNSFSRTWATRSSPISPRR